MVCCLVLTITLAAATVVYHRSRFLFKVGMMRASPGFLAFLWPVGAHQKFRKIAVSDNFFIQALPAITVPVSHLFETQFIFSSSELILRIQNV